MSLSLYLCFSECFRRYNITPLYCVGFIGVTLLIVVSVNCSVLAKIGVNCLFYCININAIITRNNKYQCNNYKKAMQ